VTGSYTGPLWVPGHPVPKGSQKCITPHVGKRPSVLVPDKRNDPDGFVGKLPDVLAWRATKLAANPVDAPVEMRVEFYLQPPGPGSAHKTAPTSQHSGDLDKLVRQVGDAVGGKAAGDVRLIRDDSRICRIVAEKLYAWDGKEGVRVELLPYTPPPRTPAGPMPVRVQAGAESYHVGSISSPRDLPQLLRAVADQIEHNQEDHKQGGSA
jgi:Holliday junction resolvase RusA-like endonuclease